MPSSSPEPFSGTGGHHTCGAGRSSALAFPGVLPGRTLLARPSSRGASAAQALGTAREALTMDAITQVLNAIEHGDPHAAEQLLPLVYDELRALAAQRL